MIVLDLIRHRPLRLQLACLLLLSLVGCANRVNRDFPTRPLLPFSPSGQTDMPERWWTAFDDPALNLQVNQALGDNIELALAMQRLRAAQALTRREASDLFPDVDGFIRTDSTFGPGADSRNITWGLDAAYQVDLWGQVRSRVEAERFRAEATRADYHAVALTLAAEVARTRFALIEAYAQLELLDGGQRRAEVDRTAAVLQQRFNEYGQTMLIAFQEVEDSLASERYQIERIQRLNAQVTLAQQSSDLLLEQYMIGDVANLDVLSAIQAQQRL